MQNQYNIVKLKNKIKYFLKKEKKRAVFHFLEKMRLCSGQPPCVCHVLGARMDEWELPYMWSLQTRQCDLTLVTAS